MAKSSREIGAALRGKSTRAAEINRLADTANGHKATRSERETARSKLTTELGKRGAANAIESSLLRAGARPKGPRRWFS